MMKLYLALWLKRLEHKDKDTDESVYEDKKHMRSVLDVILNQSYTKFGMEKGKGRSYEAILTVNLLL